MLIFEQVKRWVKLITHQKPMYVYATSAPRAIACARPLLNASHCDRLLICLEQSGAVTHGGLPNAIMEHRDLATR